MTCIAPGGSGHTKYSDHIDIHFKKEESFILDWFFLTWHQWALFLCSRIYCENISHLITWLEIGKVKGSLVLPEILGSFVKRLIHKLGWNTKPTGHLNCEMAKIVVSSKDSTDANKHRRVQGSHNNEGTYSIGPWAFFHTAFKTKNIRNSWAYQNHCRSSRDCKYSAYQCHFPIPIESSFRWYFLRSHPSLQERRPLQVGTSRGCCIYTFTGWLWRFLNFAPLCNILLHTRCKFPSCMNRCLVDTWLRKLAHAKHGSRNPSFGTLGREWYRSS